MAARRRNTVQRLGSTWVVLSTALWAAPVAGQVTLDRPLRVYLDCSGFRCDPDYFVEQVPWVDFVVDRQDADVHVLGTHQSTGAGGGRTSWRSGDSGSSRRTS